MKKTSFATIALGAGLIAALAGCTTSTPSGTPSSSSTASSTATAGPTTGAGATATPDAKLPTPKAPVVNKCVDGNAVLTPTADKPAITLTEACDTVSVVGVKGQITLGAVKHLVLEGTDNTVTVDSVTKVDFGGNDNTITHGGAAPTVTTGTTVGNTVKAK